MGSTALTELGRPLDPDDGRAVDLAVPPGWPPYRAGLEPHRVALRLACQGAVVALLPTPLLALAGAPGDVWLPCVAAAATLGAVVTLAEELASPRPRLRLVIAPVAAAGGPALAVGAGTVVAAVQAGETPLAGMTAVVDFGATEARDLLAVTALLALPLTAFVLGRTGRSANPSLMGVCLAAVCSLPAGLWSNTGPLMVVYTALWTGALALALEVGRRAELRLAGRPR